MNIRKVVAGSLLAACASTLMVAGVLGATTLDQGLGPFVKTDTNALTSPKVVVGDTANPIDVVGAADLAAALTSQYAVTAETIPAAGSTTSVSGGVAITSDLNKTYLVGSGTGQFKYVKDIITKTELPTILETLSFTDMNATSINYAQQIALTNQYVGYGKPSDVSEPTLYVQYGSTYPYNTTIIFMGGLDISAVDTSYKIKLFGNEYTFGATHTVSAVELYTSTGAETVSLTSVGDKSTVTVDGTEYEFELIGWGHETSANQGVFLKINGASTSPSEWLEGSTYTIPGTTTKVYVSDVSVITTGGQEKSVSATLFVGTKKLKITDGAAVEKNDVALVNTLASISSSGTKINTIKISIAPDTDEYVLDGNTYTDPVWGSFKFALGGMTPGMTAADRDFINVAKEGTNKVKLTFKNKEGTQYATNIFTYDTAATAWEKTIDGTYDFRTTECNVSVPGTQNITVGDYFVLTNAADKASYILKYANCYPHATASSRYLEFRDISTNGAIYKIYYTTDPYIRIGSSTFQVANLTLNCAGDKAVAVDLNGNGAFTTGANVAMYTETGAVMNAYGANNELLITETPLFTITGSNEATGATMNISASYSSSDYVGFSLDATTMANGGQVASSNRYRYLTSYGTYLERDTDADTVKIYYPGNRPGYANVAIGTNPVFSTSGGSSGGTYNKAVPIYNPVSKLASEVATDSTLNTDLVLVGGPCANTVVKKILDEAWSTTNSCGDWVTKVGAYDSGKGIIKIVDNVFTSGQKALIIAGSSGADTRNLAKKAMNPTTFASMSGSEWIGSA